MADTDDIQERIRRRAHELWESEGRPHGRDSDHWTQAEAEVRGAGALEPTGKVAGSRKKPPVSKATSKTAGKSTRAAAESLSEVASAPAESAKSAPAKPAKAKPATAPKADAAPAEEAASVKAPAKATPKAAAGKTAAKTTPAKSPRTSKKDGGKSATAG
ncbi:hypothetical protein J2848_002372 [Azospirillum lipoferum]|uniref:DUF2934 domain-containing protein n=1 Tax=Azospirillum lipoferum TaxID=193 RepID=A0A5A9GQD3_AZOLI|nr:MULTISPECIES: DUF2934 domain-containing protein [Azospirillum]KAA0596686.1 DUF2934 domain-containing protein [Azospirillum lipoferum]MCP1610705.1 hypothetical protein [Azospirillum lipoferum]MDW5537850.1 DUF2934 domain-containing protein [Azospirillum sp. NL1]